MAPNMFGASPPATPGAPPAGPSPAGPAPSGPPQGTAPTNMIAGAPNAAQAPPPPPSAAMLDEALHKTSYVASMLNQLLSKPDLSTKDVLDDVGEMVAEQVMSPFMAAKYLSDMPPDGDSLILRQWVGQHYATTSQSLQTIAEMVSAHGQMMRRAAGPQGVAPPATGAPTPAAPPPAPSPAPNMIGGAEQPA